MARVIVALVLALFMVQALGVSSAAAGPCAQQCEDDGPDGQCAPDCADCVCCVHARVAVTAPSLALLGCEGRSHRMTPVETNPPEAVVEDILRVPKTRGAGRLVA